MGPLKTAPTTPEPTSMPASQQAGVRDSSENAGLSAAGLGVGDPSTPGEMAVRRTMPTGLDRPTHGDSESESRDKTAPEPGISRHVNPLPSLAGMTLVILAGGLGTRLSEETTIKPKPMVEIGDMPILWHIMKLYAAAGLDRFVICAGYKGHVIKEFFAGYAARSADVTYDLATGEIEIVRRRAESWKVTVVDTGASTLTGGRLRRVAHLLRGEGSGGGTFCFTYGDGVCDIDLRRLVAFHRRQGTLATLTAVRPPGRFGAICLDARETRITTFREKPSGDGAYVNGGFFVLEPEAIDYIAGDATTWEKEPLEHLAQDGELSAYRHDGFWQPMDTLRDKHYLDELWNSGKAPWKKW